MAVQAQQQHYPSNAFPDFRTATRMVGVAADNTLGMESVRVVVPGGGAVLSDPESELTCNNASGSGGGRMLKRTREREYCQMNYDDLRLAGACNRIPPEKMMTPIISTGLQLSTDQTRLLASTGTSTSGRVIAPPSPLAQELVSCFYRQGLEIDALIRLQSERMRSGLEEARKRQCRTLVAAVEEGVGRRLREKEAELVSASRRNAELEERVRQIAAESQVWLSIAKNNEAIAANLRATLEQALALHSCAAGGPRNGQQQHGDSEGCALEDAASCCFEEANGDAGGGCGSSSSAAAAAAAAEEKENRELRWRKSCKVCGERDVCVLVLPCRHLCACQSCEPALNTCPICHSVKNGSLHIFMS